MVDILFGLDLLIIRYITMRSRCRCDNEIRHNFLVLLGAMDTNTVSLPHRSSFAFVDVDILCHLRSCFVVALPCFLVHGADIVHAGGKDGPVGAVLELLAVVNSCLPGNGVHDHKPKRRKPA